MGLCEGGRSRRVLVLQFWMSVASYMCLQGCEWIEAKGDLDDHLL